MPESFEREPWIDVAKGMGIVAVVAGHSGQPILSHYLYWFHIPLFFALSGYLFRPCSDWSHFWSWGGKRAQRLLVPYISFGVLVILIQHLSSRDFALATFRGDLFKLFYGGQMLVGDFTPFWFISCLFLTQIAFAAVTVRKKSPGTVLLVIGIAYLAAHLESRIGGTVMVPWSADVTLIALTYYAFGFYGRPLLEAIRRSRAASLVVVALAVSLVLLDMAGLMPYEINLKEVVYNHPLLDLVIPLIMITAVCQLSQWCSFYRLGRLLAGLGGFSLTIMYLHVPVNTVLREVYGLLYGPLAFTLIGLMIPYVAARLLELSPYTQLLFQGRSQFLSSKFSMAGSGRIRFSKIRYLQGLGGDPTKGE